MPHFLLIRRWRNLKPNICTRVYSITYARVRIVHDKSYRVDRPLDTIIKAGFHSGKKVSDRTGPEQN